MYMQFERRNSRDPIVVDGHHFERENTWYPIDGRILSGKMHRILLMDVHFERQNARDPIDGHAF